MTNSNFTTTGFYSLLRQKFCRYLLVVISDLLTTVRVLPDHTTQSFLNEKLCNSALQNNLLSNLDFSHTFSKIQPFFLNAQYFVLKRLSRSSDFGFNVHYCWETTFTISLIRIVVLYYSQFCMQT